MPSIIKKVTGTISKATNWFLQTDKGLKRIYLKMTDIRLFNENGKSLPVIKSTEVAYFRSDNKVYEFWDYYVDGKNIVITECSYIGDYIEKEPEVTDEPVFRIITDNPDIPHI